MLIGNIVSLFPLRAWMLPAFIFGLLVTLTVATAGYAQSTAEETSNFQKQDVSLSRFELSDESKSWAVVPPGAIWTFTFDKAYSEVVIGNLDILDVVPLSDTSFNVQAKARGNTNISLFDDESSFIGEVEVFVGPNSPEPLVQQVLNSVIPGSNIIASSVDDFIYLEGSIEDDSQLDLILEIASRLKEEFAIVYSFSVPESNYVQVSIIQSGRRSPTFLVPKSRKEQRMEGRVLYGTYKFKKPEESDREAALGKPATSSTNAPVVNININSSGAEGG